MLTLYLGTPASCSLATHIALEEANAAYQTVKLDLSAGDQRNDKYLALNPKGRVPTLATERGVLTETPALLFYVAQMHPASRLAPLYHPYAMAELQAFNSYLCSTVHVAHAHGFRGARWSDDPSAIASMKAKVARNMSDCFALIEEKMLKGPWVLGDGYSVADPYLFTVALWLEGDGVDPQRFAKVHDHMTRMKARPAVQRVMASYN
jgi:glutathione S-transferase